MSNRRGGQDSAEQVTQHGDAGVQSVLCLVPDDRLRTVLVTAWVHSMSLTLASLSLYGFTMGILGANVMPIICLVVDARYRATAQGIINACAAVGGGVSIYVVGALRDAGTAVGLILTMAGLGVVLCGFLLWLVVVVRKKSGAITALG